MTTIVDALVVTLGLDPRNFKKGQAESKKAVGELRDQTVKAADVMSKSLLDIGKKVALLFLGFETAVGFFKMVAAVTTTTADLGRSARNLGMSAHELNRWGNAAELAGGKAEDVQSAFQTMSRSLFDWQVNMTQSPLIVWLTKLGIDPGKLKNYTQAVIALRTALRGYTPNARANILEEAGIGGLVNLINATDREFTQIMRDAERGNKITDQTIRVSQQLQEQWRAFRQEQTGWAQDFINNYGPATLSLLKALVSAAEETAEELGPIFGKIGLMLSAAFSGDWSSIFDDLKSGAERLAEFIGNELGITSALKSYKEEAIGLWNLFSGGAKYAPALNAAEKKYGIPNNLLYRVARDESGFDPDVISGAKRGSLGETGIMQLRPELFRGAGVNVQRDIDTAAQELVRLYKHFGSWELALAAYNDGEGNIDKFLKRGHEIPAKTRSRVANEMFAAGLTPTPGALFYPGGAGSIGASVGQTTVNNNSTHIGKIELHTQATNGTDAAAALARSIQRKGILYQADQGMTP